MAEIAEWVRSLSDTEKALFFFNALWFGTLPWRYYRLTSRVDQLEEAEQRRQKREQ